jgi:hypothetical protein
MTSMQGKRGVHVLIIGIAALLLASCGWFNSLSELEGQSSATADALERDLGVKPKIGWQYFNGTLTSVNVTFEEGKVEGVSMGVLETQVRAAVKANFKEPPRHIMISAVIKP